VHHVGILYDQFMMHGQRNIKLPYGNQRLRNKVFGLLPDGDFKPVCHRLMRTRIFPGDLQPYLL